jgi:hypothetical protein
MSKSLIRIFGGFLVLSLFIATPPARMINANTEDEATEKQECCFANPKYAGICEVNPAEGETCASILEYLNDPQSAGKTYCQGTRLRIGWKQVDCETDEEEDSDGEGQQ